MPDPSDADNPKSLAWVVRAVKAWVERCGAVWVQAQVIELNRRSGPTQFLTLRDIDEEVSVTATCHRRVLDAAGPVETGMTVTALLKPTVWSKTGRLSFECSQIRPSGEGQLLAQLERRRRLLEAEGLFDTSLHKPLPLLPAGIGLITGTHSDAERDVIRNAGLRWPAVRFVVRNTLVQGPRAVEQILAALAELDADPGVDVIVIARGGGSLEDLLPFSDEALVRAVFAARTPVVSAIGHERDNPILDLVADLRASTPTDAGKRIVPDVAEEAALVAECRTRIRQSVATLVATEQTRLEGLRSRPVMVDPTATLDIAAERLSTTVSRLRMAAEHGLDACTHQIDQYLTQIRAMSPKATLDRGYAALADDHGDSVSSVEQVATGGRLMAYLADGQLGLLVESATPTESRTPAEEQS